MFTYVDTSAKIQEVPHLFMIIIWAQDISLTLEHMMKYGQWTSTIYSLKILQVLLLLLTDNDDLRNSLNKEAAERWTSEMTFSVKLKKKPPKGQLWEFNLSQKKTRARETAELRDRLEKECGDLRDRLAKEIQERKVGQIYFANWTNILGKLDKYILQIGQIQIWTGSEEEI